MSTNPNNKPNEKDYDYPVDDNDEDQTTEVPTLEDTLGIANTTGNKLASEYYKIFDSLNKAQLKYIAELSKQSKYKIGEKEYFRKKIIVKNFKELRRMIAKAENEKDPELKSDLEIDAYAKQAEYFLGTNRAEYDEMEWEESKLVLDSCMFRNLKGFPN